MRYLRLVFAIFYSAILSGETASSKALEIVVPYLPPQFLQDGSGRAGDVVQATLNRCGHAVRFTSVPFGRHWRRYRNEPTFDGLGTAEGDQTFPGFSTKPFIRFQDGATTLKGSGFDAFTNVQQFHGSRIGTFIDAEKILGIEDSVPKFSAFQQRTNRFDLIRPLFAGRIDAIFGDGLITEYFIELLKNNSQAGIEIDIYDGKMSSFRKIFNPVSQRLYFRDEAIADDFDRCYQILLDSGEIEQITNPYVDQFRHQLGDQYPNF